MNFNKGYFDRLGRGLKLNDKQISSVYKRLATWYPEAIQLIEMSFLTDDHKSSYKALLVERVKIFIA
jgi:serine/threonine-protein kinase HipA